MEFEGLQAELSTRVLGVFYSVANELGYGFFESVYRRSMVIALRESGLRVAEEVSMPVHFHGSEVGVFEVGFVLAFGERAKFKRLLFTTDRKGDRVSA